MHRAAMPTVNSRCNAKKHEISFSHNGSSSGKRQVVQGIVWSSGVYGDLDNGRTRPRMQINLGKVTGWWIRLINPYSGHFAARRCYLGVDRLPWPSQLGCGSGAARGTLGRSRMSQRIDLPESCKSAISYFQCVVSAPLMRPSLRAVLARPHYELHAQNGMLCTAARAKNKANGDPVIAFASLIKRLNVTFLDGHCAVSL